MPMDYGRACREAATRQGLDPLTEALTRAGIAHDVEQTGGFTMVVTIPGNGRTLAANDDDGFNVAVFAGNGWEDRDEPVSDHRGLTLADAVATIRREAGL